jgi:hypothetical protein
MGDVEAALAFVARRQGARRLPASQWPLILSLELGWMAPDQANAFIARATEAGLLRAEGESLHLTIDPATVAVPHRFRPDPAAAPITAAPAAVGFLGWVDRVAQALKSDRAAVLAQVAALQGRLGGALSADVAVLWVAREAGLDVRAAARALIPPGHAPPPAPATPP